ncbi:uncharacterized protein LOC141902074 [Tubulanus polymorphus]|uniref:uncharacterized protein LOC141902074 n=1 Tax=Tubulanus polymorphus TaxID=672921 RepID=UPI003DA4AEC0
MENLSTPSTAAAITAIPDVDSRCESWRNLKVKWTLKFGVYMYVGFYGPFSVMGVVINLFTLLILRKLNNAVYYLIKVLAVFDILYCLSVFVLYPLRIIHLFSTLGDIVLRRDDWHYGWEFIYTSIGFYYYFQLVRNWSVVLLSLERLVIVVFPMKARVFWTRKLVNRLIGFVNFVSLVTFLPSFFPTFKLKPLRCKHTGLPTYVTRGYSIWYDMMGCVLRVWFRFRDGVGTSVLSVIAPMATLIGMNIVLVLALIIDKYRRQKLTATSSEDNAKSSREQKVARMALAVVFIYIVFEFLTFLEKLYYSMGKPLPMWNLEGIDEVESLMIYRKMAIGLTVMDSCANFFVYCLTNGNFRNAAREILSKPFHRVRRSS